MTQTNCFWNHSTFDNFSSVLISESLQRFIIGSMVVRRVESKGIKILDLFQNISSLGFLCGLMKPSKPASTISDAIEVCK